MGVISSTQYNTQLVVAVQVIVVVVAIDCHFFGYNKYLRHNCLRHVDMMIMINEVTIVMIERKLNVFIKYIFTRHCIINYEVLMRIK